MDERDQTIIPTGAGHDARGRQNHEFRSSLHHTIQQRGERPRVTITEKQKSYLRSIPVM